MRLFFYVILTVIGLYWAEIRRLEQKLYFVLCGNNS